MKALRPVVMAVLAAISLSATAADLPRVRDVYNVGETVYVRALAVEPRNDTLWVGTSVGVLEVGLKDYQVRNTFTREHGLANEYVFGIHVDRNGTKWFGTNTGGVSLYRDGQWRTYFPLHGLADYWVYSFAEQKDGTVWVGTWAGASAVEPTAMRFRTYVRELINEWVYGIAIDRQQRVWFGTEGGVSRFDGQTWTHWTHQDGLGAGNDAALAASANTGLGTRSRHDLNVLAGGADTYNPNYCFTILVDRTDQVWAGTWGGGAARFDGRTWHNYTTHDGLAGNLVYSIAEGADGVLWFGTNRGLSRYDGKTWTTYDRNDGLLEDHVYAVTVTPNGDIWAGTRRGVVRIGQ